MAANPKLMVVRVGHPARLLPQVNNNVYLLWSFSHKFDLSHKGLHFLKQHMRV